MTFFIIYPHREEVSAILQAAQQEIERGDSRTQSTIKLAKQLSVAQRRPSFVAQVQDLQWLIPRVQRYRPTCWWAGAFLLVLRLAQSSLLVLVPSQTIQAAIASCVALVGVVALREIAPYRTASDNVTATLCQCVIFSWCFFVVLRDTGALYHVPTVVSGLVLVVGTASVLGHAVWQAHAEMKRNDALTARRELELTQQSSLAERAANGDLAETPPDVVEAGQTANSASEVSTAGQGQQGSWRELFLCALQGGDSQEGYNSGGASAVSLSAKLAQKERLITQLRDELKAKETENASLRASK